MFMPGNRSCLKAWMSGRLLDAALDGQTSAMCRADLFLPRRRSRIRCGSVLPSVPPEKMREGIARLGKVISAASRRG